VAGFAVAATPEGRLAPLRAASAKVRVGELAWEAFDSPETLLAVGTGRVERRLLFTVRSVSMDRRRMARTRSNVCNE
jgi:hypothetical protein